MHYTLPRGRVYLLFTILFVPILLFLASPARGVSQSVVISQIKVSGFNANDEFVELFNASGNPINLAGWRLSRRSSSATASAQNLVASLSGTIAPYSYFLITHPNASSSGIANRVYSASSSAIAADNTILLYSDNGQTLVDKVGFGGAQDVETAAFSSSPTAGQSIQRKSCDLDTDNNNNDFTLLAVANPHNSTSPAETSCIATPTPLPTVEPSALPTPTPTSSPEPTDTPLPTVTPTPTPTIAPTSTPMSTPQPTSTPAPDHHERRLPRFVCTRTYEWRWFGRHRWWFPRISCHWKWHHYHDD